MLIVLQRCQRVALKSHRSVFVLTGVCKQAARPKVITFPAEELEMSNGKELEGKVRREPVTFELSTGEPVTVESVIQDTLPEGTSVGTVVALHGSPGSHKDFKYITPILHEKGIRVIGINFPGYGLTEEHEQLKFNNNERNNYVKAVIEKTGVRENVVIMGHSRGCENATGSAALITDRVSGLVLLNPTGLRLHRGLRPFFVITFLLWLHRLGELWSRWVESLMYWFYHKIGLRTPNGKVTMNCVKTMSHIELDQLKPKIAKINEHEKVRVLQAYSGNDLFVEVPVSQELAESWHDHHALACKDKSEDENELIIKDTRELFYNGKKSVSVHFMNEDHFLQKNRARFVAEIIEAMLKSQRL